MDQNMEMTEDEDLILIKVEEEKKDGCEGVGVDNKRLIRAVKNHPELYSSRGVEVERRNELWEEVAKEMGNPNSAPLYKKRWKTLKDSFVRYLRRSASDQLAFYKYAEAMDFLTHKENNCCKRLRAEKAERKEHKANVAQEKLIRTDRCTKQLINIIKEHPCLYNTMHEDYHNMDAKVALWNDISAQIKCDVSVCKSRWYTVRDAFKRANKRKGRYKYDKQLSFLLLVPGKKRRKTQSNDPCDYDLDNDVDHLQSELENNDDDDDEEIGDNSLETTIDHGSMQFIKEEDGRTEDFVEIDRLNVTSSQEDAINVFLLSLGPTLRTLRPYLLNRAKTEIFGVVQKYELEMLQEQECNRRK